MAYEVGEAMAYEVGEAMPEQSNYGESKAKSVNEISRKDSE
jgi:hypothetical protein